MAAKKTVPKRVMDRLNRDVTNAIFVAERTPPGSPEARSAWGKVATCEAKIAAHVPMDELEGAIARRGVVTAFLSAGCPRVASLFAGKYFREASELPDLVARRRFREELESLFERRTDPRTAGTGSSGP